MKKKVLAVMLVAMCLGLAACASKEEPKKEEPKEAESKDSVKDKGKLMMATTTSTEDTGLLDYLKPLFKEDTGWDLEWNAVGTGEALKMERMETWTLYLFMQRPARRNSLQTAMAWSDFQSCIMIS